jgi:hypothetical protein
MDTFERLSEFIIFQRGKYKKPFTEQTTLEKDLGITGDDADEFMDAFFTHFNINYSNFQISKYFYGEGFDLFNIAGFIRKLLGKKPLSSPKFDITLYDLMKSIESGKWIENDLRKQKFSPLQVFHFSKNLCVPLWRVFTHNTCGSNFPNNF